MEGNCRVTGQKRKSCISTESSKKRQRVVCEATEVAVKSVMTRGTKRELSSERESPKRKRGSCRNETDVNPAEVAEEAVTAGGTKRH